MFIALKAVRQKEMDGDPPSADLLSRHPQQPGLGPGQIQELGTSSRFPTWVPRAQALEPLLLNGSMY